MASALFRVCVAIVFFGGCGGADLSSPSKSEPFLYVVISPEPLATTSGSTMLTAIHALLLTTGSPMGAPFRHAERFEVTSIADGSTFAFTERSPQGEVPGIGRRGANLDDGNYVLPFATSSAGRGANELRPLGVYQIIVESGGHVIGGRVLMPNRPEPAVVVDGSTRFVTFPPVTGAAAYFVAGDTETRQRVTTETTVQLAYDRDPAFVPANPEFLVVALDSNFVRYISDTTRSTSGVVGALGLVGAANPARVLVPWPN